MKKIIYNSSKILKKKLNVKWVAAILFIIGFIISFSIYLPALTLVDEPISINTVENGVINNSALIHFNGDHSTGYLELESYSSGWNRTGLVIQTANTGSQYDGINVGIGTTNPAAKLHIQGYETLRQTLDINGNIYGITTFVDGCKYIFNGINPNRNIPKILVLRNDTGHVGIGTYVPSSELEVVGTTTSNTYSCSSDARYKKNVNPYDNALEKVLGLRGVSYFWKTDEYKERNFSKDKQLGFIAQEVEKIIPEIVYTDDKGYKTMSYDRLTAVIVEAIKELKTKNDQKLSALEKENAELKRRLAKLDGLADRLVQLEKAVEKEAGKQHRLAKQ